MDRLSLLSFRGPLGVTKSMVISYIYIYTITIYNYIILIIHVLCKRTVMDISKYVFTLLQTNCKYSSNTRTLTQTYNTNFKGQWTNFLMSFWQLVKKNGFYFIKILHEIFVIRPIFSYFSPFINFSIFHSQ